MKNTVFLTAILILSVLSGMFVTACNPTSTSDQLSANSNNPIALYNPSRQPAFDIELYRIESNGTNTLIYKESTGFGAFQLQNGLQYDLKVISPTIDASFTLSFDNGSPVLLRAGDNSIPGDVAIPQPGERMVTMQATLEGATASKSYSASISCSDADSPMITLNANAIQVSLAAGAQENNYVYQASGIVNNPPAGRVYECAWDVNGDGIRDSDYMSCDHPTTQYSNHVGTRNIRVYVRDSVCNRVFTTQAARVLAARTDAALKTAQLVYISGTISSSNTSPALNLRHLSTNVVPNKATCNYNRSNGKGSFTVTGAHMYGLSTSRNHNLSVSFENITDSLNEATGTGAINSSAATIKQVHFSTDEAPDLMNRFVFSGGSQQCTGTVTIRAQNMRGTTCYNADGSSGVNGSIEYVADGDFRCVGLPSTMGSNLSVNSVNIDPGSFHCETKLTDSCWGGGGGGGGGQPPYQY